MSDLITRATVAAAIRGLRQDMKDYPYSEPAKTRAEVIEKAYRLALPAYGWPGGYDLLYYVSDNDQLTGDVLCHGCAITDLQTKNCQGFAVESSDNDYESDVCCDQCGGLIAAANIEEETAD